MAATDRDRHLNRTVASLDEVIARHGEPPWSERLVLTDRVQGVFIYQAPGQGNRRHYHHGEDELWVILKGRLRWTFDDEVVDVQPGDVVFCRRGRWHQIEVIGDEPAVRFAVARPDIVHLYEPIADPETAVDPAEVPGWRGLSGATPERDPTSDERS